jgi:penicillin-binding protein 2
MEAPRTHPAPQMRVASQFGWIGVHPPLSKYYSPYATRNKPRRWPAVLAVLLALLVGAGVGIAATGGVDWFSSSDKNPTETPRAVAANDETSTPGQQDEAAPTATDEPQDEQPAATNTAVPEQSDPTETPKPTATTTPENTPTPDAGPPDEAAKRFLTTWSTGDYHALYKMISAASKATISEQDFVDRFDAINTEAGITEVKVESTGAPDLDLNMPIKLSYKTGTVGDFSQTNTIHLVREGPEWHVDWSPSLIFTQLGDGCVDFMVQTVRRGSILDRNGNPLAYDGTASVIGVIPGQFQNEDAELKALSKIVGIDTKDIKSMYADADPGWFVPIKSYANQVDDATKTKLSAIPGAALRSQTMRIYPLGKQAAHITGYVTRVTAEDIDSDPTGELAGIDWIGRAGIEAGANDLLTGRPGGRLMVVDCNTRAERTEIASRRPQEPKDIVLTVDKDFQVQVDNALGDVKGSAIVIDPRTGGILALASHPAYDPNWFVSGMTGKDRDFINNEDERPLLDRAAEAAYPTGSIFKVITMAAAMHDLKYTGDTQIDCPQEFSLPGTDQVWRDWTYEEGLGAQGMLTLHTGLVNSCNTVFYQIGAALDEQNEEWLPDMAKAFGLGAPTGIPYFPEVSGTVPSPEWKQDVMGDYWARGDAVNMAIGQGFVEATPLQMANAYTAIANGGTLLQPFIVEFQQNPDGSQKRIGKRTKIHDLPLSDDQVAEIQSALRDQTSNSWGAGSVRVFGDFQWPIAGKTGTAQNQMTVDQKPHSWFAAFGPYGEEATVSSIVMVESSGEGVTFAAPRTRTIYEAYLKTDLMNKKT